MRFTPHHLALFPLEMSVVLQMNMCHAARRKLDSRVGRQGKGASYYLAGILNRTIHGYPGSVWTIGPRKWCFHYCVSVWPWLMAGLPAPAAWRSPGQKSLAAVLLGHGHREIVGIEPKILSELDQTVERALLHRPCPRHHMDTIIGNAHACATVILNSSVFV